MLALAIDVGYLLSERRGAQVAADAAALAGASALLGGSDSTEVTTVSTYYADQNGIDLTTDTISVDIDGDRHGGQVTVNVNAPVPRFFLGALYSGPWEVSAHAVAEVVNVSDARYALVALGAPGINVNGSTEVSVLSGSMMSNDDIDASDEANVITSHGFIDAAGTINENATWSASEGIREFRSPISDPFAAVTPPNPIPTDPTFTSDINCPSTCTMEPGYYQDVVIQIFGEMMLDPGLYYFKDSSIELMSEDSRISGSGVTLYFDGSPTTTFFKPNLGKVNLTAPNWPAPNNDFRDMAIWIDNCTPFNAMGDGELFIGGALYAPCSPVTLHGNPGGETVNGMVVADQLDIIGDTELTVSCIPFGPTDSYEVYLRE